MLILRQRVWVGSKTRGRWARPGPITRSTCRETSRPPGWSTCRVTALPDVLPNTVNVVVWYEVVKKTRRSWRFELKKHDLGAQAAGHGVGSGDVNGDGRTDLLTPKGWFEAPADPSHGSWAWHQTGSSGQPASRSWLATSMAMDYPISSTAWDTILGCSGFIKPKARDGEPTWTKQTIDGSVASVHALMWADIDGDGKAHELVTGKRVYAHEIEPGATDGSLIAWYAFDPSSKNWVKHMIFQGEPAKNAPAKGADRLALRDFPPGTAGTGLQMTAIDIDRDGDLDLVCPGKSGLYLFENLQASK